MAPARIEEEPPHSWPTAGLDPDKTQYKGPPRNIASIDAIKFPDAVQPKNYEIHGTHPDSKILFTDVVILDSTGREPYKGDVLIEGNRLQIVGRIAGPLKD